MKGESMEIGFEKFIVFIFALACMFFIFGGAD